MSALSLTMRDLSRVLNRLDLDGSLSARAEVAAQDIEKDLINRGQPATATVDRGAIIVTGPNLWDREHGQDGGNLTNVLRERGIR